MFQASQYDSYSYLFYQPTFIILDPNATVPANMKISGIRIGVNGALAPAGQSYATLNATVGGSNYTAANGPAALETRHGRAGEPWARTMTCSSCRSTSSARTSMPSRIRRSSSSPPAPDD